MALNEYDVLIIGGGITGAGVLRDCAMRGLKAALLEKSEPGQATTAASSHLIHGGLRYLLYDRLTTHTTAWDSGNIVRIAKPFLRRLPILWPLYRRQRRGPETVETLLECYDGFQPMKGGLSHLRLGPADTLSLVPGLKPDGLIGSLSFDEWWVDAEGLVEANLKDARRFGAAVLSRTQVTDLTRSGDGIRGVRATSPDGTPLELKARLVVNATGPWISRVSELAGITIPLRLRQGTHLVYDKALTPLGLLLEAEDGDRYVFVIPYEGGTLVGPTDIDAPNDPDALRPSREETDYLAASVRRYLPGFPRQWSRAMVGARPILGQRGSEKLLSREYHIFDHGAEHGLDGLVTAGGGKMSDFRLMAKDTTDLVCGKLGIPAQCRTHLATLEGEALTPPLEFPRPWRPVKNFLRRHPHLRELHAMTYLGAAFARHCVRRLLGRLPQSTLAQFRAHYDL